MKNSRYLLAAVLGIGVAFLAACQNNKSQDSGQPGGPPPGYATTPQPCNLGQPNCTSQYGVTPTPYAGSGLLFPLQANYAIANCGCPAGMMPYYNQFPGNGVSYSTYGLACGPAPANMANIQYFYGNPMIYNPNMPQNQVIYGNYVNTPQYNTTNPAAGMCGGTPVIRY